MTFVAWQDMHFRHPRPATLHSKSKEQHEKRFDGDKRHGEQKKSGVFASPNLVPFALFKELFGSAQIIAWRVKIENVAQFVQNVFNKVGIVLLDAKH